MNASRKSLAVEALEDNNESAEQIITALGELTPRTRQVFVLCRVKGMRRNAVARRLDIPDNAVEKHMISAIAHLGVRLGSVRLGSE